MIWLFGGWGARERERAREQAEVRMRSMRKNKQSHILAHSRSLSLCLSLTHTHRERATWRRLREREGRREGTHDRHTFAQSLPHSLVFVGIQRRRFLWRREIFLLFFLNIFLFYFFTLFLVDFCSRWLWWCIVAWESPPHFFLSVSDSYYPPPFAVYISRYFRGRTALVVVLLFSKEEEEEEQQPPPCRSKRDTAG